MMRVDSAGISPDCEAKTKDFIVEPADFGPVMIANFGRWFTVLGVPDVLMGKLGRSMADALEPIEIVEFSPELHAIDELTEMLHAAYAGLANQGLRFTATYQKPEQTLSRVQSGVKVLIASQGNQIIGTIALYSGEPNHQVPYYQKPGLCYFGQFGVHPDFAGQGLGKQLYEAIEKSSKEQNYKEISLDTAEPATQLIAAYHRWGFKKVDTYQWGDTNYLSVILSKQLDRL